MTTFTHQLLTKKHQKNINPRSLKMWVRTVLPQCRTLAKQKSFLF